MLFRYYIGAASFTNGKLSEVTIQCTTSPEPPDYHLYEPHEMETQSVVDLIKAGNTVGVEFDGTDYLVEVITLPDGSESVEVVQKGQPEKHRTLANLRECD